MCRYLVDCYHGAFGCHPKEHRIYLLVELTKRSLIAGTHEHCRGRCRLRYECVHKASPGRIGSGEDEGEG
jgi:hypothetical protein